MKETFEPKKSIKSRYATFPVNTGFYGKFTFKPISFKDMEQKVLFQERFKKFYEATLD